MKRFLLAVLAVLAVTGGSGFAHEGEDHGGESLATEGAAVSGPLVLSPEMIETLDVQTQTAEMAPAGRYVSMFATVEPVPEQRELLTSRFEGQVVGIFVKLGERIRKGQPVLRLQPSVVTSSVITVPAPMDGVVFRQNVVPGQRVSPSDVMVEIAALDPVLVRGVMYEAPEMSQLRVGQRAIFAPDSHPDARYSATIQRLDMGIEVEDRTFKAYGIADNADGSLIPGLRGEMQVEVESGTTPRLLIPRRAVLRDAVGGAVVFVRDGVRFERREIVPGIVSGDRIEVLSGVFPGEEVVTQGQYQLQFVPPHRSPSTAQAGGRP